MKKSYNRSGQTILVPSRLLTLWWDGFSTRVILLITGNDKSITERRAKIMTIPSDISNWKARF